jgi:hypothetical protein
MALADHSGFEVIDLTLSDDENDDDLAEEEASEDFDSDTSVYAYAAQARRCAS